METYIQINGFENYEISNLGNIRNIRTRRILKQLISKRGYYKLNLRKDNKSYSVTTHRLVALTHLINPNNLPEVDHKDKNRLNNRVSNLRWASKKLNLNNKLFKTQPRMSFNEISGKFFIYQSTDRKYFEYDSMKDAFNKFSSLFD